MKSFVESLGLAVTFIVLLVLLGLGMAQIFPRYVFVKQTHIVQEIVKETVIVEREVEVEKVVTATAAPAPVATPMPVPAATAVPVPTATAAPVATPAPVPALAPKATRDVRIQITGLDSDEMALCRVEVLRNGEVISGYPAQESLSITIPAGITSIRVVGDSGGKRPWDKRTLYPQSSYRPVETEIVFAFTTIQEDGPTEWRRPWVD